MSVCKMFVFKNEKDLDEFEISGSTYEPIGDVFYGGKVKPNVIDIFSRLLTVLLRIVSVLF